MLIWVSKGVFLSVHKFLANTFTYQREFLFNKGFC